MKVYLSGAIMGRSLTEIHGWRNRTKRLLPAVEMINPADTLYPNYLPTRVQAARIVNKDKADIDRSDLVLVYFDQPSAGTMMEILYAWERHKKVVIINASGKHISPWLLHHSTKIFTSLTRACKAIKLLDS